MHHPRPCLSSLVAGALVLAWSFPAQDAYAQQQGCPGYDTTFHWPEGTAANPTIVWYTFASSLPDVSDVERAQINSAITKWNTANAGNGSHVQFVLAGPGHAAFLTFQNTGSSSCVAGDTSGTPELRANAVTITIYVAANCNYPFFVPGQVGYDTVFEKTALHEVGHTMGLKDVGNGTCTGTGYGISVMDRFPCVADDTNDHRNAQSDSVSTCDNTAVHNAFPAPPGGGGGGGGCAMVALGIGIAAPQACTGGGPPPDPSGDWPPSPIILDVGGDGFDLSAAEDGVAFDLQPGGSPEQLAWTVTDTNDGWLALDRNGNGVIDDGTELFGNFTPQAPSDTKNGFAALAVFDDPDQGGNGDGVISGDDAIFEALRIWLDANHDGISEPGELFRLEDVGIEGISLEYATSRRRDAHGNEFRFRARVFAAPHAHVGRFAFDVFLTTVP